MQANFEDGTPEIRLSAGDNVEYISKIFDKIEYQKLKEYSITEIVDYVIDHTESNNTNQLIIDDINDIRDVDFYYEVNGITISKQVDQNTKEVIIDERNNKISDNRYWTETGSGEDKKYISNINVKISTELGIESLL